MIHGNNLIVSLNGTAIGAAKTCSISFGCDTQEVSSPSQGTFKQFITSRKSWMVTVGYMVTAVKSNLMRVGQSYTLSFGVRGDDTDKVTGTAICTTCKIDGQRGNIASGTFEFKGIGELS